MMAAASIQQRLAVYAKTSATYHVNNNLDVYAQWAQGFRMPAAQELYQNYGAPVPMPGSAIPI